MSKKDVLFRLAGVIALAVIMAFSLAACGDQGDAAADADTSTDPGGSEVSEEAMSGSFMDNKDQPLEFETVDFDGNKVSSKDFSDASLIMVNFWEPWCGPCVSEMPELQKLYENYRDRGLVILGAFSTGDMDEDVESILKDCGTTYPVIRATDDMNKFMTDYYPTTIFADGSGRIICDAPVVGAQDYDAWEETIKQYLGEE